jgi:hypothetical protein
VKQGIKSWGFLAQQYCFGGNRGKQHDYSMVSFSIITLKNQFDQILHFQFDIDFDIVLVKLKANRLEFINIALGNVKMNETIFYRYEIPKTQRPSEINATSGKTSTNFLL